MESLRTIKNRMRSIKNTSQITKAMEMVAASKMRRAQEFAINTRFYTIKSLELLANLGSRVKDVKHFLLEKPQSDKVCFLAVASDKGLCGGFNSSVLSAVMAEAKKYEKGNIDIVAVGKRGADFLKNKGFNVVATFSGFGDYADISETSAVARFLLDCQKEGRYRDVFAFYNKFISTLKQKPMNHEIAPFNFEVLKEVAKEIIPESGRYSDLKNEFLQTEGQNYEYIFEPSSEEVLKNILPNLFEIVVHYIILEANASEHSARMMAMKNASENTKDILKELNLSYNKARQANITRELSEISAGAEALK